MQPFSEKSFFTTSAQTRHGSRMENAVMLMIFLMMDKLVWIASELVLLSEEPNVISILVHNFVAA